MAALRAAIYSSKDGLDQAAFHQTGEATPRRGSEPYLAVPGEVLVLVVPGAICDLISAGDPSDLVASEPDRAAGLAGDVDGEVVVAPVADELDEPVVEAPIGVVAPPGGLLVVDVPGATCDLMSPGEPCDLVASDASGLATPVPMLLPVLLGAPAPPGD